MNKKCPNCQLINFSETKACVRCDADLIEVSSSEEGKISTGRKIIKRAVVCVVVCILTIFGFYLSLIFTSKSLSRDEKTKVADAVKILDEKGFSREVLLLRYLTSFRANDHWLNASTRDENAYAATNFPFEIMTIYRDFFEFPQDDTERAAILLHEAQHLKGADEKEAYEFVWKNRKKLGWTKETHGNSTVWRNVRRQTKEFAPHLFICTLNDFSDCTE